MRILIFYQVYLAPGNPGSSRFNEFARLWAREGHDVTVVCGSVNYQTGDQMTQSDRAWVEEYMDGDVRVLRTHVPRSYSKSFVGRGWAYLFFALTASSTLLKLERPDVIIASSPPLTVLVTGLLAAEARWGKTPWVFEVRDLWPESAVTTGVLGEDAPLTKALYGLEALGYRRADLINVLTPAFTESIVDRGLAPRDRVVLYPNGADLKLFTPGPRDNEMRRELDWGDRFVAMYAGAHGRANALHQLIECAEALREREDIQIATVGDGPLRKELVAEAKRRGLERMTFHGAIPKERMRDAVNAADAGIAVLQNNPTFRTVYPNKVFDYMACERPTLLGIDGVARDLVCTNAQAGLYSEPENGVQLAERVLELANDLELRRKQGRNGRAYVETHFDRDKIAMNYLEELVQLVERKRRNA